MKLVVKGTDDYKLITLREFESNEIEISFSKFIYRLLDKYHHIVLQ